MEDVVILGCGAIGSRLALECAQPNVSMLLLDDDRVDRNNWLTGSTAYWAQHEGAPKPVVLAEMVYRRFGTHAVPVTGTLTPEYLRRVNYFAGARLIIDGFDNAEARRLANTCHTDARPVMHVGVSAGGTGMIAWGDNFPMPPNPTPRGENPVCTHQLGRRLITFTAAVAATIALEYLETGLQRQAVVTNRLRILE